MDGKMKNSQIMSTDLISVFSSTSVHEASKILKENKVRHLLVRDKSLRLVGVISDRDLIKAQNVYESKGFDFDTEEPVSAYMSTSIKSVDIEAELVSTISLMLEEKISSILVMDENRPVGIITSSDVMGFLLKHLKHQNLNLKIKTTEFFQKAANEISVQLARIGFF